MVVVRWQPPISDGGSPVTGYLVTPHTGGITLPAHLLGPTVTTDRITALTNGQSYTFSVTAINAVGSGPSSPLSKPVTALPLTVHSRLPHATHSTARGDGRCQVKMIWPPAAIS